MGYQITKEQFQALESDHVWTMSDCPRGPNGRCILFVTTADQETFSYTGVVMEQPLGSDEFQFQVFDESKGVSYRAAMQLAMEQMIAEYDY